MSKTKFLFILLYALVLSACSTPTQPATEPAPTETSSPPTATLAVSTPTSAPTLTPTVEGEPYPPPFPTTNPYPAPTQAPSGYPAPLQPAAPVAVTFPSLDGTLLAGTYYAPLNPGAPVVVLMHQFGSSQRQWDGLALWLQTGTPPAGVEWLPPMREGLSFAVLTFDFRGHGESAGSSSATEGFLLDAQSALAFAKTQAGVDPLRVITIGTSIGADSAVDACIRLTDGAIAETQESQGCLGAMPLSPGSFVGVNYTRAAETLIGDPHFALIYCVAAEGDSSAPQLCNSISDDSYRAIIYPGNAHGLALLKPGQDPDIGSLILEFLLACLELRQ